MWVTFKQRCGCELLEPKWAGNGAQVEKVLTKRCEATHYFTGFLSAVTCFSRGLFTPSAIDRLMICERLSVTGNSHVSPPHDPASDLCCSVAAAWLQYWVLPSAEPRRSASFGAPPQSSASPIYSTMLPLLSSFRSCNVITAHRLRPVLHAFLKRLLYVTWIM